MHINNVLEDAWYRACLFKNHKLPFFYGLLQIRKYHRFDALWECKKDKMYLTVHLFFLFAIPQHMRLWYFVICDKSYMMGNLFTIGGQKRVVIFVVGSTHISSKSTYNIHPYYFCFLCGPGGHIRIAHVRMQLASRRLPTPVFNQIFANKGAAGGFKNSDGAQHNGSSKTPVWLYYQFMGTPACSALSVYASWPLFFLKRQALVIWVRQHFAANLHVHPFRPKN